MEKETAIDLDQIQVIESLFLECIISNPSRIPISPNDIAGFEQPTVHLFPMVSFDERKVAFDTRVNITTLDADGKQLPVEGSFRIYMAFRVDNLPELTRFDESLNQQIPISLLTASLVGTAYSTIRGMIMNQVASTVLSGLALPLRSVRQLMDDSRPHIVEEMAIRAGATEKPKAKKRKPAPPKQE